MFIALIREKIFKQINESIIITLMVSCQTYSSPFLSVFSEGREPRITNRYQTSVESRVYILNVYWFGRFVSGHGRHKLWCSKDRLAYNHSCH